MQQKFSTLSLLRLALFSVFFALSTFHVTTAEAGKSTQSATRSATKSAKARSAAKRTKKISTAKRRARATHTNIRSSQPAITLPATAAGGQPLLKSSSVIVQDQQSGDVLFEKNSDAVMPIASITKLMTAMVVLDAQLDLNEMLEIGDEDVDRIKGTSSRLPVGTVLSREEMLRLALMASENRAASALSRYYPGGRAAFVEAMNVKTRLLGLQDTRYYDSTGLNKDNVSSARDLMRLVAAASSYPLIREFSTTAEYTVDIGRRSHTFRNTNALVRSDDWEIGVSKTGFINESGKCLVMQAWVSHRPVIIVLLDSWGKFTRLGDANRIKHWVETAVVAVKTSS